MNKYVKLKMTGVQARFLLKLLLSFEEKMEQQLYAGNPVLDREYFDKLDDSNKISALSEELHFLLEKKGWIDCFTKEEMKMYLKSKQQLMKLP